MVGCFVVHSRVGCEYIQFRFYVQPTPELAAPTGQVIDRATKKTGHGSTSLDDRLKQVLASAGETDRGVLLMLMDNISNAPIADVMGVGEAAIRVRLHRIRKRIQEGDVTE